VREVVARRRKKGERRMNDLSANFAAGSNALPPGSS
jgi:hypothetical protein